MTERRYDEAEVAAIFERATEAPSAGTPHASSAEGMTLAEVQAIGREVGISAESIALAAEAVDQAALSAPRTFLGMPLGVARTVILDRKLSDEEWDRLVVDLRETFDARGVVKSQGSLRQWTNGNLQALLEPTATGQQLRLRTFKGNAPGLLAVGLAMVGLSAGSLMIAALRGTLGDTGMLFGAALLGLLGVGTFATTAVRLPQWARTRARQMEEIAARVALFTRTPPT